MDLLLHTVLHALEHGAATGQDDVLKQVSADVRVTGSDALVRLSSDTLVLLLDELRVEEDVRCADELISQHQLRVVRKLELLNGIGRLLRLLKLGIEVLSNVAPLLLDMDLDLLSVLVRVFSAIRALIIGVLVELPDQEFSQIVAAHVDSLDSVRDRIALEDWHGVSAPVSGIEDCAGRASSGKERQNGLLAEINFGNLKLFHQHFNQCFASLFRRQRRLSQDHFMFVGRDEQLVVENLILEDVGQDIDVSYNALLDRVRHVQIFEFVDRLVTIVSVLDLHTDHRCGIFRAANNHGAFAFRLVITGDTGLQSAGANVHDDNFFVLYAHYLNYNNFN